MSRRRPRRAGNRNRGGRPPAPRDPIVTPQMLAHRQQQAPGIPQEDLMKQRAGVPLEILAAMPCPDYADGRKAIGEALRQAGEQYGELVHRWRRMHQVPDGTRQKVVTGAGSDVDPRHVATIDARMAEAQAALDKVPVFARAVVESICVDEFMGRAVDRTAIGKRARDALREGLSALCEVFRVPARRAA